MSKKKKGKWKFLFSLNTPSQTCDFLLIFKIKLLNPTGSILHNFAIVMNKQ